MSEVNIKVKVYILQFGLPDKRTKSFRSRPLLAKEVWRLDKLLVGGGIFAKASEALDIFPSLLPVGTFQ